MAYVAGSASVDIVPDFRRAQLAITSFFEKQKDDIRVRVTPVVDEKTTRESGRRIGKQLGDALNDESRKAAVERQVMYARMFDQLSRQEQKAGNDRIKAEKEFNGLAEAIYQGRLNNIAKAHAEALQDNARLDREAARVEQESLRSRELAYRRLFDEIADREKGLTKAHTEALRENERRDRESVRARTAMYRDLFAEIERRERDSARTVKENAAAFERAHREALGFNRSFDRNVIRTQAQVLIDQKQADEEARKWSGGFTQALEREFYQRRVFISSVMTGALTAGGPAVLAATSVIFAGLGAVAVASASDVQQAWSTTWQSIRSGAQADAAVLIPTYSAMAGRIGQAFQDIRPLLRTAFSEVAPQIETMTTGLIGFTNSALPGMVRGLSQAGPAIEGLSRGIQTIGSGLGEFFVILGENSQGFGALFDGFGEAVGGVLPLLAEMSGTAAEVGGTLLPLIGTGAQTALGGLRALDSVLGAVGGSLSQVIAGFVGFRVFQNFGAVFARTAQSVGGGMTSLATQAGLGASAVGRVGGALSAVGRAAPGIGIVLGAVGAAFAYQAQQASENAQGLDNLARAYNSGGAAAVSAAAGMRELRESNITRDDLDEAIEREDDRRAALTRSQRAAEDLEAAQRNLDLAIESSDPDDNAAAMEAYAAAQEEVAAAAAAAREIYGVTAAMAEQASQAESRVDAELGYQEAILESQEQLDKVAVAQTDYNDVVAEFGANSDQARQALLNLNQQQLGYVQSLKDIAAAAADVAMSDLPASMNDTQREVLGAKAALDELNAMLAMGMVLPPELEAWRQQLMAITGQADGAVLAQAQLIASLSEIGVVAAAVPGTVAVAIDADTPGIESLIGTLEGLGFTIREVDGEIRISAQTDEAQNNVGELSALLAPYLNGQNVPDPIPVEVDPDQAQAALERTESELQEFANSRPAPVVLTIEVTGDAPTQVNQVKERLAELPPHTEITVQGLTDQALNALATLGFHVEEIDGREGEFTVSADTAQAETALSSARERVQDLEDSDPVVTADLDYGPLSGAVGFATGVLATLANQRPTPTAGLNWGPLNGAVGAATGVLAMLANQRPTPTAGLNWGMLSGAASAATSVLATLANQRPTPTASLIDRVTAGAQAATQAVLAIPNRTVTLSVVTTGLAAAQNILAAGSRAGGAALGGSVDAFLAEAQRRDGGGSVIGAGGPTDDRIPALLGGRIPFRLSNGEHVLDAQDVALMGGQAAVYRFREMLNSGQLRGFADGGSVMDVPDGIRRMVAAGDSINAASTPMSIAGMTVGRDLVITDNAENVMRAADSSKRRTLVELGIV